MAIQLLSIPTVVGGTTTGYPDIYNTLKAKINELATIMSISPLTLSAVLGAGSPASDLNTMVSKVNELVNYVNGTTNPGDGGSGGTGTFPLKSGYDGNQRLSVYSKNAGINLANGFTQTAKITIVAFNNLQYFLCNGSLDTLDENASLFCEQDGVLKLRYRVEGGQITTAAVGITLTPASYYFGLTALESGGNVLFATHVNGAYYPLTVTGATLHKTPTALAFGGVYVNGNYFNAAPIALLEKFSYLNTAYSQSQMQAFYAAGYVPTPSQLAAAEYVIYGPGPTSTASSVTTENLAGNKEALTVNRFS